MRKWNVNELTKECKKPERKASDQITVYLGEQMSRAFDDWCSDKGVYKARIVRRMIAELMTEEEYV